MNLKINGHSPIPIRRQLMEQLRHAIEAGGVARDQALPSIRELAGFLGVNPNTVARAYRELEGAGFVEKRRTAGTYISDQGSPLARRERLRILTERIDALLAEARQMDIAFEDVVKLAERRHATMLSTSTEV